METGNLVGLSLQYWKLSLFSLQVNCTTLVSNTFTILFLLKGSWGVFLFQEKALSHSLHGSTTCSKRAKCAQWLKSRESEEIETYVQYWIKNWSIWVQFSFQTSCLALDMPVMAGSWYPLYVANVRTGRVAGWWVSSWYQPLPQPELHCSCRHCSLHNCIRFCETEFIPVCLVLGLHGQPWKWFLFKPDSD